MPTIDQLLIKLNKKGEVVQQAKPGESIQSALDKMFQYNFSQLPIVENDNSLALITIEKILKLLSTLGTKINECGIVDSAKIKIERVFRNDDDLFALMEEIERSGSALVVDGVGNLINIITTYDTTQFFQEWSEDTMFVGDIEKGIKDIITSSFKTSDGVIDLDARKQKVNDAFNINKGSFDKFHTGLKYYFRNVSYSSHINKEAAAVAFLEMINSEHIYQDANSIPNSLTLQERKQLKDAEDLYSRFIGALQKYLDIEVVDKNINERLVLDAFSNTFKKEVEDVDFDKLTLHDYLQLFFTECWGRFENIISFNRDQVEFMLDGVRKTRNSLAHFHLEEIKPMQREQLKYCYNWLLDNQKQILKSLDESAPSPKIEGVTS